MSLLQPINFKQWIEEHRHLLKPPVGNQVIWKDSEFIVMVVGGPNSRRDYHVDEGEEFFYQLEGDLLLKVVEGKRPRDLIIKEGEIFLLPARIPHSPRRQAGTVGLVIERTRRPEEKDGFVWFCENCGEKLHQEYLSVTDIVNDLPAVFERFYSDRSKCICRQCGMEQVRPRA